MAVFSTAGPDAPRLRLAGAAWIGTLLFFVAELVTQWAAPGYSMRDHDISFLAITACGPFIDPISGATLALCSPLHLVMGGAFILTGLLVAVGAVLSYAAWPPGWRRTCGLWLLVAAGAGTVVTGMFSVDTNAALHGLGALVYFSFAALAVILLGSAMWRRHRSYAAYSIATGLVSILAFLLYGADLDLGIGRGVLQRLAGYPSTAWFVVSGALLVASQRHVSGHPETEA